MQCPRCHNTNVKHLYKVGEQFYCRECIQFHRIMIDERRETFPLIYPEQSIEYQLDFELSDAQKQLSQQLVTNYQQHLNSLVLAVCGSGKTEIVFELIQYALSKGQRVCFCIPRKELVKELYQRIAYTFVNVDIGLFYGGHTGNQQAQLIICTMHQLYRFENDVGFDLMIADEVDAFPFYQNQVLNEIFQRCCLGNYVKLSATFTDDDVHDEQLLIMHRRYHGYDLPVPKMIICPKSLQTLIVRYLLKILHKKVIIYVPTVELVNRFINLLYTSHKVKGVSSKHLHNQKTIQQLKDGDIDIIISTTLLERGMTIEDVQVIIYQGEHTLFDRRTLIQMAGRVGRKPNYPTGKVYILTSQKTKAITQCINQIKKLNQMSA